MFCSDQFKWRAPKSIHQNSRPKKWFYQKPATHTSLRRSNSRHVAYSTTQGRCCTALQFYSSLFCITFLPIKIFNVTSAVNHTVNSNIITTKFFSSVIQNRIRSEFQRSRRPCVVFFFANAFFERMIGSTRFVFLEANLDPASIVIVRFIPFKISVLLAPVSLGPGLDIWYVSCFVIRYWSYRIRGHMCRLRWLKCDMFIRFSKSRHGWNVGKRFIWHVF